MGTGYTIEPSSRGLDVIVTGKWTARTRAAVVDNEADGLVVNYAKGFRERDLRFLDGLPLRRLQILARTLSDLAPIYSLAESLESLQVETSPNARIDLARLPRLRTLGAIWSQVQESFESAPALEDVFLLSYSEPDLTQLTPVPSLSRIVMKDHPGLRTLNGAEDLPGLSELGVHLASELSDISALEMTSSPVLHELQLTSCARIPSLAPIAHSAGLEYLNFSECGGIPSLAPLAGLTQLKVVLMYGSTRVVDSDLTPLMRLPHLEELRMRSRRGYAPRVAEIQATLPRTA